MSAFATGKKPINQRVDEGHKRNIKKAYRRPKLVRLGSLREMTLGNSFGGPDGRPHRGTGRGGDN